MSVAVAVVGGKKESQRSPCTHTRTDTRSHADNEETDADLRSTALATVRGTAPIVQLSWSASSTTSGEPDRAPAVTITLVTEMEAVVPVRSMVSCTVPGGSNPRSTVARAFDIGAESRIHARSTHPLSEPCGEIRT